MSSKKFKKAYAKELALELRNKNKKKKDNMSEEELLQLMADQEARNGK